MSLSPRAWAQGGDEGDTPKSGDAPRPADKADPPSDQPEPRAAPRAADSGGSEPRPAARASAQPPPERPREAATKSKRPKYTLWVYGPAYRKKAVRSFFRLVRRGLKASKRVKYRSLQLLLERKRRKKMLQRLIKADKLMAQAKSDMENLEIEDGIRKAKKAVRYYEYGYPLLLLQPVKARPLANSRMQLAIGYYLSGKKKKARAEIRRALVIRNEVLDFPGIPRSMRRLVRREQRRFRDLGTSDAIVATEPPGSKVYFNGRYVGRARKPIKVVGVPRGWNLFTARRTTYRTKTIVQDVEPPNLVRIKIKLKRFKNDPVPMLEAARAELGAQKAGPNVLAVGDRLGVPLVMLATAELKGGALHTTVYWYDVRSKQMIKGPIKATAPVDKLETAAEDLSRRLLDKVRLDGKRRQVQLKVELKTKTKKPGINWWVRFRRSKAFWPTIGGVAGVVVTGVVVGLVLGLRRPPRLLGARFILQHRLGFRF